jgi:hypothetical protein
MHLRTVKRLRKETWFFSEDPKALFCNSRTEKQPRGHHYI